MICIEPVTEDGQPYKPWRLRDSPLAIATFAEAQTGKGGYMDEAMVRCFELDITIADLFNSMRRLPIV